MNSVDYNDYYIASGTNNYVAFWGSSSLTTLGDWQSTTGKDSHSKNVNPSFASSTDLHSSCLDLVEAGTTISTGSGDALNITTDYDGDFRGTPPDIGADEFSLPIVWTGMNGSNWNDPGNWDIGMVPTEVNTVTIPTDPLSNPNVFPVLPATGIYKCWNITISSGASVTIPPGGRLEVMEP
jgi:hypothetical protein